MAAHGWANVSYSIDEKGPQNDNGRWDPATVIGLKCNDEVLVVGNAAFMPWLLENAKDVTSVRKSSELYQFVKEGDTFDKVIFARETTPSREMFLLAAALLKNNDVERGVIVIVPNADGWTEKNVLDFYFPEAILREFDSTFGQLIMAEVPTTSWRMIHNG